MSKFNYGLEVKIAAGLKHGVAVSDTGVLYSWGSNAYGQLAQSESAYLDNPNAAQERMGIKSLGGRTKMVACQDYATYAIIETKGGGDSKQEQGQSERPILFAWGRNEARMLGLGPTLTSNQEKIYEPQKVYLFSKMPNEYPKRIYCGPNYCALITEPEARLYTWGNGGAGNLGHDTNENITVPTVVKGLIEKNIVQASCGAKHMMALTHEKQCYSWGTGQNGRLGLGDTKGRNAPTVLETLINKEIVYIECGESHSMALSANGDAYSWGNGSYYRLGHGDLNDQLFPKQIVQLGKKRIVMVAAGMTHSLAITMNGNVYGWGSPMNGVLGMQDITDTQPVALPRILNRLEGIMITQIAVGKYHSMCCNSTGDLYCWGHQGDYRLGYKFKDNKGPEPFPRKVPNVNGVSGVTQTVELATGGGENKQKDNWKIVQGAVGSQHTLMATAGGNLWVWGEGCNGSLGTGNTQDKLNPYLLAKGDMGKIVQVCAGEYHTMAINSAGEVFTWGDGSSGQLGTGRPNKEAKPKLVDSLCGKFIVKGCCGEAFSAVLTDQGHIYTWGDSDLGKLGLGQNVSVQYYPRIIKEMPTCKLIAAGTAHMAAIDNNGMIYTWGSGFGGRLGHGDQENQYFPKQIMITSLFSQIACGNQHTVAIDDTGYLYTWGSENRVCSKSNILTPLKIPELKNRLFQRISAGQDITLALNTEGTIYVWGQNLYGKLGLGKTNLKAYQVQPNIIACPAVDNVIFTEVYCKYNHCAAITSAGDVFTWGAGGSGRLGHGVIDTFLEPKKVSSQWQTINEQEEGDNQDEGDAMAQFEYIQKKVNNGKPVSSFQEFIILIQQEHEFSQVKKLKVKEKAIMKQLSMLLTYIKASKNYSSLINKYENQINKVILQRRYQLNIPEFNVGETSISPIIANFMQVHEKIIWALQSQPCYLQNLIQELYKHGNESLEQVIMAINYFFQKVNSSPELEKRSVRILINRDQLLYINLCKIVIRKEVNSTGIFEQLFQSNTPTSLLLRTFFNRELGSTIPEDLINEIFPQDSGDQEISRQDIFTILAKDVAFREKIDINKNMNMLMQDRRVQNVIQSNGRAVITYTEMIMNKVSEISNNLSRPIKICLYWAKKCIEEKTWHQPRERNKDNEFQALILKKLIVLLNKNLIFPLIQSPENSGLLLNINQIFKTNLVNLTTYLNLVADNETIPGGEVYLKLNTVIKESWERLYKNMTTMISTNESIDEELVCISYDTQFIIDEPIIQMPQKCYIEVLKQFKLHQDSARLNSTDDFLYDQIKLLGNFAEISAIAQIDTKFNIKVPVKFMINDGKYEVQQCPDCNSAIPNYLNKRSKADGKGDDDAEEVSGTVLQVIDEENMDNPVDQITYFCRQNIKRFEAVDLNNLVEKLDVLYLNVTKSKQPQYELATIIKQTEKMVKSLINQDTQMPDLLQQLTKSYTDRQAHKAYLDKMNKFIEQIISTYGQFQQELRQKQADLEMFLTNSQQFRLLFKYAYNESKNIRMLQIKEQIDRKKEMAGLDLFPQGIRPEIVGNVKLTFLKNRNIIKRFTLQYNTNLLNNTNFHFFNTTNDGWFFHMMFKQGSIESMFGRFQISNAEFSDLKRTANKSSSYTVANLGIDFNTFEFLKFLQDKIQQHVF